MNDTQQYDTIVLSGGGLKAYATLGSIQAAIDKGLLILKDISNFVGTSIGAILGYLFAIGYTPIEIIIYLQQNKILEQMKHLDLLSMINGTGAASYTPINQCLEKMTLDKIGQYLTLSGLKEKYNKTLVCTTYNMTTCQLEYLSYISNPDLPCITALRMSSNIPLIFDRFKYMDNYYIDGGICANFPILKAEEIGKKVFGVNLTLSEKSLKDEPKDGVAIYFLRLFQIPIQHFIIKEASTSTSTIVNVKTDSLKNSIDFNLDLKIRMDMFSLGYKEVENISH